MTSALPRVTDAQRRSEIEAFERRKALYQQLRRTGGDVHGRFWVGPPPGSSQPAPVPPGAKQMPFVDQTKPKKLVELDATVRPFPLKPDAPLQMAEVRGVDVEHAESLRFDGVRNEFLSASALTTVRAEFGKLTAAEFGGLKEAFGGRSKVPFDPARNYEVIDFLPPGIQAVVNRDVEVQDPAQLKGSAHWWEGNGPEARNMSIALTTNCHGTAWEAMRAFQGQDRTWSLFFGDAVGMSDLAADAKLFDTVAELPMGEADRLQTVDLKPGDLVQFHEVQEWQTMASLLHSAVYVGGGLFFEKPDTERADEDSPFRLATAASMIGPISDFSEGKFRMAVLRARRELPVPSKAFASGFETEGARLERKKRLPLGTPLLKEIEVGMGGGMRSMNLAALKEYSLEIGPDGRGSLRAP